MKKIVKRNEYKLNIVLHESKFMNALLQSYGFVNKEEVHEFLYPDINKLNDPFLFRDMKTAVELIKNAIKNQQKIVVFHDYDCDGVCASFVLSSTISYMGGYVDCMCPTREEGYGLNIDRINLLSKNYNLIITVDLGISNYDEVRYAKNLGMNVIISDHHQIPNILPEADAIIHPQIDPYPFKYLCGTGVAYKIAKALIGEDADQLLDIVATATIGDIVTLTDENRTLVKFGLEKLSNTKNLGLKALIDVSGLNNKKDIKSLDVAFKIVPRLNVAGRMETADIALKLLQSKTVKEAEHYADILNELNKSRRESEQSIIKAAFELLSNYDFNKNKFIVVSGNDWNSGIVGLAAGKICEKFHLPVAVFSIIDDKATASIRSIKGLNIYEVLKHCSDLFIKWGGHEQAAGVTINAKDIEKFSAMANDYISKNIDPKIFIPCLEYDHKIDLNDVTLQNCDFIEQCEPFGEGNPKPKFLISDVRVLYAKKVGLDGKHLKLSLGDKTNDVNAIAFGMGDKLNDLQSSVEIIANMEKNTFNGKTTSQLAVEYIGFNKENELLRFDKIDDDTLLTYKISWLCEALKENRSNYFEIKNCDNELTDYYGTLVVSYDKKKIYDYYTKNYQHIDIATNFPNSETTLNSLIVMPDWERIKNYKYNNIILLDSNVRQAQIDFLHYIYPTANIINEYNVEPNKNIYLGIEKFRQIYINLLKNCYNSLEEFSQSIGEDKEKLLFALFVFESLGLIFFDKDIFKITVNKNPKKCDLEDSPLIKAL